MTLTYEELTGEWDFEGDTFERRVSFLGTPVRKQLKSLFNGVSQPFGPDRPAQETPDFETYKKMRFFRSATCLIKVSPQSGALAGYTGTEENSTEGKDSFLLTEITNEDAIRKIYEEELYTASTFTVDNSKQEVNYYPSRQIADSPEKTGIRLMFNCHWAPALAEENENKAVFTFEPSIKAQIRHGNQLTPWTCTIHKQPNP
jgi:hypothetical protein